MNTDTICEASALSRLPASPAAARRTKRSPGAGQGGRSSAARAYHAPRSLELPPARGAAGVGFFVLAPLGDLEVLADVGDAPRLIGAERSARDSEREKDRAGQARP